MRKKIKQNSRGSSSIIPSRISSRGLIYASTMGATVDMWVAAFLSAWLSSTHNDQGANNVRCN
jgi:hypothetical protein